jgi:Protein of unknown function (DUF3099)
MVKKNVNPHECQGCNESADRLRWGNVEPPDGNDRVPPPTRGDKRRYFTLMAICIGLFVISWALVARYSVLAAAIISGVALVIPPVAAIVGNATSATSRRRP